MSDIEMNLLICRNKNEQIPLYCTAKQYETFKYQLMHYKKQNSYKIYPL